MTEPLDQDGVQTALDSLPGWSWESDALKKTFSFRVFPEAISFITRIAFEAEARNHHPEIRNVYGTVEIALTTHDAGNRVTAMDVDLAKAIEKIAWV